MSSDCAFFGTTMAIGLPSISFSLGGIASHEALPPIRSRPAAQFMAARPTPAGRHDSSMEARADSDASFPKRSDIAVLADG
jgi:hypothetical protein